MLKQLFLAHFEPMVTRLGQQKIPKCLQKWAVLAPKKGQKWVKKPFLQTHLGPFGMRKELFLDYCEPVVKHSEPWTAPKCLENGLFWDQK